MATEYGNRIDRVHTIKIKWTLPIPLDKKKFEELRADKYCGWYYITRKFGETETALYIGKAEGFIYKRILQHSKRDSRESYMNRKGLKLVRFGTVENVTLNTKEKISRHYHLDRFLKTIESELIQVAQPLSNISQSKKYTRWYKFRIISSNISSDLLNHVIENKDNANTIPCPKWWKGQLE